MSEQRRIAQQAKHANLKLERMTRMKRGSHVDSLDMELFFGKPVRCKAVINHLRRTHTHEEDSADEEDPTDEEDFTDDENDYDSDGENDYYSSQYSRGYRGYTTDWDDDDDDFFDEDEFDNLEEDYESDFDDGGYDTDAYTYGHQGYGYGGQGGYSGYDYNRRGYR